MLRLNVKLIELLLLRLRATFHTLRLYYICERKFHTRTHVKITRQWKSTLRQVVEVASSGIYLISQVFIKCNRTSHLNNVTPQYTTKQDFPGIIFSHPTVGVFTF